jgi:hypothetical protein
MPDATLLRYATLPPRAALVGLADELSRRGRVLAVTDGSRLPWSPSRHRGVAAPHWLLVTGRRADSWHVVDAFAGLLPGGEQRPFAGWLSTAQLTNAMLLPEHWLPEQHTRNRFAFGFPVPVPQPVGPLWLRREPEPSDADPPGLDLPGTWLVGDDDVLPFLADYFATSGPDGARHLDDLWTSAAHRVFRYRWLCSRPGSPDAVRQRYVAARDAWAQLPSAVRFAVDSAARGRPRPSLLRQTFAHLQLTERGLTDTTHTTPGPPEVLTSPRREAR